jgi:lambda repressor-like predicted transcriptional regulator
MGSRITEIEKLTFLGLHKSGMSIREISRRTGRSTDSIKQYATDDVAESAFNERSILNDEDMHKIFDLHTAGMRVIDISRQMNQPSSTVRMVIRRLYPKHQKAYAKWLEVQKEKEAPALVMEVQPVELPAVPAPLLAIRTARTARSASEPMLEEVQPQPIVQPENDWELKWSETQKQIAHLTEINDLLKEHIKVLKSLR